jgi:hypothetical protein
MHQEAQKALQNKANARQSEAGNALRKLNESQHAQLSLRFRNAHAIAKAGKSFKDYVWLCKLDKAKGLDIGNTYQNDKAASTFVHHIAKIETEKTTQSLGLASFFSISIDEATDVAGEENESIYLHWCHKGVRQSRFLSFVTPESTRSCDIYSAVQEAVLKLSQNNPVMSKVVGLTTDGASNMTGHLNGVAALIKSDHPEVITTHCLAHRVELAVKDHIKKSDTKLYDKAMTLLIGLYYFYKKSYKQKKQLMRAFEALAIKPMLPLRVGGTRWVPHTVAAIEAFCHSHIAICSQLDSASHGNAKAGGLSKLSHDAGIITYLLVLKVR